MADDPWAEFRVQETDPWKEFKVSEDAPKRSWTQTARSAAGQFVQGVPIVGHYAPDLAAKFRANFGLGKQGTDEQAQLDAIRSADSSFRKDNPLTSLGLRVGGAMVSTAPAMPVLGALAGPSTGANVLAQGAFGTALGSADEATKEYHQGTLGEKGSSRRISESGFLNGLFGMAGPIIGKIRTPGHVTTTDINLDPAKRAGQELKGVVDEMAGSVPNIPKPTAIEDQIAQAKDLVRGNDFGDLLAKHFPPYQSKPTNIQISPAQIEQAAGRVAPKVEDTVRNVFVPPTDATKSAITHGIGAATGAALGAHDPAIATMAALLGHQVAPYAAQMGSAVFKGMGGHPDKYWNNRFMIDNPGVQDILNLLGQGVGKEYATR